MFAHAACCVQKYDANVVILQATVTDVFVLAMYYSIPGLKELWIQRDDKFIDVTSIVSALSRKYKANSRDLTGILFSVYILTGCDTVSYPFNKGKRRVLTEALRHIADLKVFGQFGKTENERIPTEETFKAARNLFAILYGRENFKGTVDMLRAHLYGNFKEDLRCLPPTEDALKQHVLGALIQIIVCKSAHLSQPNIPDPTEYGRHIDGNRLVPTMMLKEAKQKMATKSSFCQCKKRRCLRGCSCARRNIRCAVSCMCRAKPDLCARLAALAAISDDSDEE